MTFQSDASPSPRVPEWTESKVWVDSLESAPARVGWMRPGTRLGAYEIIEYIACGGMAAVWLAYQHGARGFRRLVALKTVLPELSDPETEAELVEEARVIASIDHPNVRPIFELIEDAGLLALSMEWVDGDTLHGVLTGAHQEPLDCRIAAHIVSEVACGLHSAHELRDDQGHLTQLIHRDVSPQNVLISKRGYVKLADFGVAMARVGRSRTNEIGQVRGKLGYMSPEQACALDLDRRTDIFSLGVILYEATVGRHPFRHSHEDPEEQIARLLIDPVPPPSEIDRSYPPELERIVLRALEKKPEGRFATAAEMQGALQQWLMGSGGPVSASDVAEMIRHRTGARIDERDRRIERCGRPDSTSRPRLAKPRADGRRMSGVRLAVVPPYRRVGPGA